MSHELRTPLNSLLILSKLLSDNPQGNLNEKQVEFARTINSAGSDLLNLINDILDLSKIESGTVTIEVGEMPLANLKQHMERTFRQLASDKGLDFRSEEHTSELQSLMRISYAVFCLKKKKQEKRPSTCGRHREKDRSYTVIRAEILVYLKNLTECIHYNLNNNNRQGRYNINKTHNQTTYH